jgi:transposase
MARVAAHLSVSELEQGYRAAKEATASRHYQAIWLLAKGHTIPEVSAATSFGTRWLEQLLARYNADGPTALGDRRRHNGRAATILKPELLAQLGERLRTPPPDGGLWSGPKVAAWLAGELGLQRVAPQRGWEALRAIDWTIQVPRPQNPGAATAEEREAFKKSSAKWSRKKSGVGQRRRSRSSPATSTGSA